MEIRCRIFQRWNFTFKRDFVTQWSIINWSCRSFSTFVNEDPVNRLFKRSIFDEIHVNFPDHIVVFLPGTEEILFFNDFLTKFFEKIDFNIEIYPMIDSLSSWPLKTNENQSKFIVSSNRFENAKRKSFCFLQILCDKSCETDLPFLNIGCVIDTGITSEVSQNERFRWERVFSNWSLIKEMSSNNNITTFIQIQLDQSNECDRTKISVRIFQENHVFFFFFFSHRVESICRCF